MSYSDFLKKFMEIPVIDTHEHLMPEEAYSNGKYDVFNLFMPYVCDNLMTAGMSIEDWRFISNNENSFEDKWQKFSPYILNIKYTTYFQALLESLRKHYNVENFTKEEALRVSNILNEETSIDTYSKIFKELNIEKVMSFGPFNYHLYMDNSEMIPVPTVSDLIPRSKKDLEMLYNHTGIEIHCLEDLVESIDIFFKEYKDKGITTIKFGSAYHRKLDYEVPNYILAKEVFSKILYTKNFGDYKVLEDKSMIISNDEVKPLDDYLTEHMIRLAEKNNMVVVFHIGIHAWNENFVEACRASYLNDLIARHLNCKIILLHSGIPFIDEAILLAKYYRNVYVNMTWMHVIDREKSKEAVKRYIEMLPVNKVMAFGGDYCMPQNLWGHLKFAYENIAEVFYQYVQKGIMTEDEALEVGKRWFYDNPKEVFNIKK